MRVLRACEGVGVCVCVWVRVSDKQEHAWSNLDVSLELCKGLAVVQETQPCSWTVQP